MTTPASEGRRRAVETASNRTPRIFTDSTAKASELFGTNTFDQKAMAERLPKDVYRSLVKTAHGGLLGAFAGIFGPGTPIPASAKDVLEQIRKAVA